MEVGPKYEKRAKGSRATARQSLEPNSTHSSTTVPTPKVYRRSLKPRRQEVSPDVRLSVQRSQVRTRANNGTVGGQSEPGMG